MTDARAVLDRLTIADAMSWKFLQAYVGRSISISAIGTELRVRFETDMEAEQMAQFIKPGEE